MRPIKEVSLEYDAFKTLVVYRGRVLLEKTSDDAATCLDGIPEHIELMQRQADILGASDKENRHELSIL